MNAYVHRTAMLFLAVCGALLVIVFLDEAKADVLKVYFLDIGQGDAIYARTPSGKDILIDGGPSRVLLRRLSEAMPWYDRRIDVVLATHPDADHIGGFPELLKRYDVGLYLETGIESENSIDDEVRRLLLERSISTSTARRGMRVDFRDGTHFDILYPDPGFASSKDTNTSSVVGKLTYGNTSIMFTGDSTKSVERRLISFGDSLDSDILKIGHHGSKTSTSPEFLDAVSPEVAIISLGKGNRYGHPHPSVIEELSKRGINILRTDEKGTIEIELDGARIIKK